MKKKRYGCLLLAAGLLMSSAVTVRADDYKGKDGWKAEFTGREIRSNFTSQTFADEVADLLPGDSIEIRIAVKNGSDRGANWYMSSETVRSLENSSPASGGAYTYELTYEKKGSAKTIYSSRSVGTGEGLHEVSDSLERFFYLDNLSKGSQGYITLKVALDGETQGNTYQNTLARLQMNFAVEGTADGGSGSGGGNRGGDGEPAGTPGSMVYSPGAVQTGDPGGLVLWSAAALACGLLLMLFGIRCRRRNRGGHEDE